MNKLYVLVSQGIEILRTTNEEEAVKILTESNEDLECNDLSIDNKVFMYEEDL